MNYEYLCLYIGDREENRRTELLNEYATQGWELVCAGGVWWVYMRRRIEEAYDMNIIED